MKVFNVHADEWERAEDVDGWRSRDAPFGARLGAELLGATLYEVDPGQRLCPYHTHHANEEWLIVVRGEPTLRTEDGMSDLREGDIACFPRGKAGLHQVSNGTSEPVRIVMVSTLVLPDVVEYPDSAKVGARSAAGERIMFGRPGPVLQYYDGED